MSTSLSTVQNKNPNNNKLPTEILLQIFSHLSGDDYRNRNLVKQVCKSWYDAAAYHYQGGYAKVVVINYHKNQIYSALLQHFSKNPHFRSKVKSLVMHDKYSGSSLKTKIKSLFLNDDFKRCGCVKTLLQLCPNLVELDFLEGDTATSRYLDQIMKFCKESSPTKVPKIEKLFLFFSDITQRSSKEVKKQCVSFIKTFQSTLTHPTLTYNDEEDYRIYNFTWDINMFVSSCPSLKYLYVKPEVIHIIDLVSLLTNGNGSNLEEVTIGGHDSDDHLDFIRNSNNNISIQIMMDSPSKSHFESIKIIFIRYYSY